MREFASKSVAGATLIELVVTIVLMSIALVTLALTVSLSAGKSADSMVQVKAVELAQSYIEEILTKRFDENTPIGGIPPCSAASTACGVVGIEGEVRATFDDVDDYHNLNESPPKDSSGIDRSNYAGYSVLITVQYMTPAQVASYGLDNTADAKLITASISPPSGTTMVFSAFKANF